MSTIALVRRDVPPRDRREPPPGWHEAASDPLAVTWVRDQPLPPAGGVTWKQKGLKLTELSQGPEDVRLRVDRVPTGGGRFVLSRLDWPGYEVTNARRVVPVDDYLLTLRVPESSEGEVLTLSYAPPHWGVLRAGLLGAIGLGLAWSVLGAALHARRRSPVRTHEPERDG